MTAPSPGFTLEAFHNEYLPEHSGDVDAVVSVRGSGLGAAAGAGPTAGAAQVIMIDCSGSMDDPSTKIRAAKRAVRAAVDALPDDTLVAVVAGRHDARMVFPPDERMVALGPGVRSQIGAAVNRLKPSGGTAIGTWLTLARRLLAAHPGRLRHGILLTDGRNEHQSPEDLATALAACRGVFTADARGIGTGWKVEEVRGIAEALLGTADIVAEPDRLDADFAGIVARAVGRGVGDVGLRVWTPRGATVRSLKQVAPTLLDLTDRRTVHPERPLIGLYPTGSWGDETREYHLRIAVDPLDVGEEILAARVAVVVDGEALGPRRASAWSGRPTPRCPPASTGASRTTRARRSWRRPSRTGSRPGAPGTSRPPPPASGARSSSLPRPATTTPRRCSNGSSRSTTPPPAASGCAAGCRPPTR